MTTTTFDKVTAKRVREGVCSTCGRKRRRTYAITHTVSPFNRTEQAQPAVLSKERPKTREEVAADVRAELGKLLAEPFVCATCAGER